MAYPIIKKGSKIGIHATQTVGQAIDKLKSMKNQGIDCPVWKVVDNLGAAVEAYNISPNSVIIFRFCNPDDSAQDIEKEGYDYQGAVNRTFNLLYSRFQAPEEKALLYKPNFWVEVLNEADPPGVQGWGNFGRLCGMMAERATKENIKIMLPAFNNGTPEYDEFIAFTASGVFQKMVAGNHILSIHEGQIGIKEPVIIYGTIPNAPAVNGAGVLALRYRYWLDYLKKKNIPIPGIIVTEFYAGGGHGIEPDSEPKEKIVERFITADKEYAKDPEIIAILPFTICLDDGWKESDYTYVYDDLIKYMVSVKDRVNGGNDNIYFTKSTLNVRAYAWIEVNKPPDIVRSIPENTPVTVYWTTVTSDPNRAVWACISPNRNEWVSMAYLRK